MMRIFIIQVHDPVIHQLARKQLLLYRSLELLVQKSCITRCPYMVINVSVQRNGGLLPDIILMTLCDSIGEPF